MGLDRPRWPELMLGLERVRVLEGARDSDGRLHVAIETTDIVAACRAYGVVTEAEGRGLVRFADLPAFGNPSRLVRACCRRCDVSGSGVVRARR